MVADMELLRGNHAKGLAQFTDPAEAWDFRMKLEIDGAHVRMWERVTDGALCDPRIIYVGWYYPHDIKGWRACALPSLPDEVQWANRDSPPPQLALRWCDGVAEWQPPGSPFKNQSHRYTPDRPRSRSGG